MKLTKTIAVPACLLLCSFAFPVAAHQGNDCAARSEKIKTSAERTKFLKSCLAEETHKSANIGQAAKEKHCDANAKNMKLEGARKIEYLDHCYKENDFDKNAKPHPKDVEVAPIIK